jgi:hypothetical protein
MQYDERYTPLLQRAGLIVISYSVRRGLPKLNPPALTALIDRYIFITACYTYLNNINSFYITLRLTLLSQSCRWQPETHTFHLLFGEMTVTLEDCQKILGLSITRMAVIGPCRSDGWRDRVHAFLGRDLPHAEEGSRTSGVQITWLCQAFGHYPANADLETVVYYCGVMDVHPLPHQLGSGWTAYSLFGRLVAGG